MSDSDITGRKEDRKESRSGMGMSMLRSMDEPAYANLIPNG